MTLVVLMRNHFLLRACVLPNLLHTLLGTSLLRHTQGTLRFLMLGTLNHVELLQSYLIHRHTGLVSDLHYYQNVFARSFKNFQYASSQPRFKKHIREIKLRFLARTLD